MLEVLNMFTLQSLLDFVIRKYRRPTQLQMAFFGNNWRVAPSAPQEQ
jgi:hypothetical protein